MKKYMIVYEGSGGDFYLPGALFADSEEEIDKFAEQLNEVSMKYIFIPFTGTSCYTGKEVKR